MDWWGNQISIGGSVDQDPLKQTLEYQQVLLARKRDRMKMELGATMELRVGKGGLLREEEPLYLVREQIQLLPTHSARIVPLGQRAAAREGGR